MTELNRKTPQFMSSAPFFLLVMLIGASVQYIAPYIQSAQNLSIFSQAVAGTQTSLGPFFSIIFYRFLVYMFMFYIAYLRGEKNGRSELKYLILAAAFFDLIPFVNWIPFIATTLFVYVIIVGTKDKQLA